MTNQFIVPHDHSGLKTWYLALHIAGGQVGLPIMVITFMLSKNVYRHPTLINFCITWIIFSVSYCLLLYSGHAPTNNNVPSPVCRIQSLAIEGSPPMAATASLVVVIQIWRTYRQTEPAILRKIPQLVKISLALGFPYLTFIAFVIPTVIFENKYLSAVSGGNGLYCTFTWKPFYLYAGPIFCLLTLVVLLAFEVATVIRMYQMKKLIDSVFPLASQPRQTSICIRVSVFTLYSWVAMIACALFLTGSSSAWGYMIEATLPLTVVIVFGTQKDLFLAWQFWRRQSNEGADKPAPAHDLWPEEADTACSYDCPV